MKKIKVVVSQSGVTAGQLKDLFRMIDDGTVDGNNLTGFLASPHKFAENQSSVVRALSILGEKRVFALEKVAEALNPLRKRAGLPLFVPPQNAAIPYSDEVLKQHAGGKWALVYSYGISLREQRQMVGINPDQQPCFYNNDWWLNDKENDWATKGVKPGWYPVCLEGKFGNQSWNQQEEAIKQFGDAYERADEHLIGEVCLCAYLINNERLLENFYHWGKSLDSDGGRVHVGVFGRDGLLVNSVLPDWFGDSRLRVCLVRKFQ